MHVSINDSARYRATVAAVLDVAGDMGLNIDADYHRTTVERL
jgi:hypothetical protein